jgi:hypothetical protein
MTNHTQTRERLTAEMVDALTSHLEGWVTGQPGRGGLLPMLKALRARMVAEYGEVGARAFEDGIAAVRWLISQRTSTR